MGAALTLLAAGHERRPPCTGLKPAISVLYIIASSGLILFAGGWHASEAQATVLFGLLVAYLAGALVILVWSSRHWRGGKRSAYLIPLLIPVLSLVTLLLLTLAVDLFNLQDPRPG